MNVRTRMKSSLDSPQQSGHQLSTVQKANAHSGFVFCCMKINAFSSLIQYFSSRWFCLLFYPFQLRNMCVQDGSVWTKVWWMPPGVLPLQQHWLPALPVSQPHQLLPSTVWWVCWGHRNVGSRLFCTFKMENNCLSCTGYLIHHLLSKYMAFSKTYLFKAFSSK